MSESTSPYPYTNRLRSHMQTVGLTSFKALSQAAQVSEWQVTQLRRGKADQMRLAVLWNLAQALHLPLEQLLATFSALPIAAVPDTSAVLKQEYERLQTQMKQQAHTLNHDFQRQVLQALETLLIQMPTAAYAAQQNPEIPAQRLLPLLKPLDQLLAQWGIVAIAPVGTVLPYDPQVHQLLEGTANPGEPVRVRYTGYRQGEVLLYRAKVSPV
jgi:transcriptional regulator with XRE-family HTH domain